MLNFIVILGFTNAASLAKKAILAQELCVNLGGLDNLFSTSPSIGTETRAGWSLQSLKHIIIQAGSLLDKLTSDKLAAKYESKCTLPMGPLSCKVSKLSNDLDPSRVPLYIVTDVLFTCSFYIVD